MLAKIRFGLSCSFRAAVPRIVAAATRATAAGLLLFAAGQKWLDPISAITIPGRAGPAQSLWLVLAAFEAFWGLWLLSGVVPRTTRWLSACLFAGFGLVAAYHGALGHRSCDCFGRIQVDPWLTGAIDFILAGAFSFLPCDPSWARPSAQRSTQSIVILVVFYVAVVVPAAFLVRSRSMTAAAGDANAGIMQLEMLEPERWTGKRFPLVGDIDIGPVLMNGQWKLFFYRPGCDQCADAIGRIREAAQREGAPGAARWAFIALPAPGGSRPTAPVGLPPNSILGRLQPGKMWIGNVPFTIELVDGNVE